MDPTLRRLLDTWGDATDPLTGLETFRRELSRLSLLSPDELHEKLAVIRGDVDELGVQAELAAEQADRSACAYTQAQELARTLEEVRDFASVRRDDARPMAARGDGKQGREATPTGPTVDKVLGVMRKHPHMTWTPQYVYDQLRRDGDATSRTSVQTTLQRLATTSRLVQRVAQGKYQLLEPQERVVEKVGEELTRVVVPANDQPLWWVTDEVLDRVAADAADRFLVQHPGEGERSFLIDEAKRRVSVWAERHSREPDDEGHVRRLMKSALNDFHKRHTREKQPPYLRVIEREG